MKAVLLILALGSPARSADLCDDLYKGTPPSNMDEAPTAEAYDAALKTLDIEALKADMEQLMTNSIDCWPADFGHYGPFFVRLAWHCSGSYRKSDGVGGCGGGRQRFEPERSWDDNTNLDKARALLYPLKAKYGDALSWGDLFILAGTTALRHSGAPLKQMCFGRMDDRDGSKSVGLGPSAEQKRIAPCDVNGMCKPPLGATTIGLIYVNPEGPVMEAGGKPNPDPALSAKDIRQTFEQMGHSDRATVALIGAHALGKTHGACPAGPGPSPNQAFNMTPAGVPWPGMCGTGKGEEAFTSGFEGPWTTKPLEWDNEYFRWLVDRKWEKHIGPGGHWQWRVQGDENSKVMRLTSDVALLHDPKYHEAVKEFAHDMDAFNKEFEKAWFDLTTTYGAGTWSKERRCDNGSFPSSIKPIPVMLSGDAAILV